MTQVGFGQELRSRKKTSGLGHVKSSSARWAALVSWRGRGAAREGQLVPPLPTSRVPPLAGRAAAGWQHTISSSGGALSGPGLARSLQLPRTQPHCSVQVAQVT
ncbi:hypothetical protein CORC01_14107 [Colletotrichum orchidophilum]|uniref:Uncharacterized protein n=1 Tax=Colletotrichum orchidophilum TaxID=1209926 RepID=A0A1G4ANA4_9PEZI|nr:uncharacterized protein CORC01_14107 [Colletotrichum orchidophilum]OHE90601.1 hypothetical protein CORC01_14107 [Colletotrichum orchidophilum]